jgi:hypothetical protein
MSTGGVDHNELVTQTISLDKSIRYCGISNQLGEIVAYKVRANLKPILTIDDWNRRALHYTMRYSTKRSWEKNLGRVHYHASKYDKIITAVIQIGSHQLLIVSFDSNISRFDDLVRKRIIPLVDRYQSIVQ